MRTIFRVIVVTQLLLSKISSHLLSPSSTITTVKCLVISPFHEQKARKLKFSFRPELSRLSADMFVMSSACHTICLGSLLFIFVFSSSLYFLSPVPIKLRRTTKGEVWEVVNIQDMDETLSVLTSLKQVVKYDGEFRCRHTCV